MGEVVPGIGLCPVMYLEIRFEPESNQELFPGDRAVFTPVWGTLLGLCASQPRRSHTQPRLWGLTLLALALADPCPCPPRSHPQRVVGTATRGNGLCPWVPGRPRSLWFRGRNTSILCSGLLEALSWRKCFQN